MLHRRIDVRLRARLEEAARPEAITDERVRAYCADLGIEHHRFEAALLRQAFQVVDPAAVLDRVLAGRPDPIFAGRVHLLYWRRLAGWLRWWGGR